jgi:glycosyltransferase involved in cell wall biosynthesis
MKKKLLLIGSFSNFHMYNYTKNIIPYIDFEVIAINTSGDFNTIPESFLTSYKENNIHLVSGPDPRMFERKMGKIRYRFKLFQIIKQIGKVDILHIHYVSNALGLSLLFFLSRFHKIILTYWGSDLYRTGLFYKIQTLPLLISASNITLVTEDMKEYYKKLPYPFCKISLKSIVLDYGDMLYYTIDKYRQDSIKLLRKEFGFNPNKIVVTIGYNGRKQMQQKEVVHALLNLPNVIRDKIQLIFPILFICQEDKIELKTQLDNLDIEYYLIESFLDENRISKFRLLTDIFIHSQTTDALSNTMLEALYAGSIVINGNWLEYSALNKNNVYYFSFSNFSELEALLANVVNDIDHQKLLCKNNKSIIESISSWSSLRNKWIDLYK